MTSPATPERDISVPVASTGLPTLGEFWSRRFATRSPLSSWLVFERLGGALAYLFSRTGVSPLGATLLGGAFGISGAVALASASRLGMLVAGGLLLVSYCLDCSDGQLARGTGRTSAFGAWLDVTVDAVTVAFIAVAVSVVLQGDGVPPAVVVLLAGAYGASRTASLFTVTVVRREGGGIRWTGLSSIARAIYLAVMDTPVVYLGLVASRPWTIAFFTVVLAVVLLTVVQTVVSARNHFRSATGP